MTKPLLCTCACKNEPIKHYSTCRLQKSSQFRAGKLVWNMYQGRLTTKDVAIDDEVQAEKQATALELAAIVAANKARWSYCGDCNVVHDSEADSVCPKADDVNADLGLADYPECPTCKTDVNVACADCGNDWLDCACGERNGAEWYCRSCGIGFACDLHYDEMDDELAEIVEEKPEPCTCKPQKQYCWSPCGVQKPFNGTEWSFIKKSAGTTWSYTPKCRHYNSPITLPDEVIIHVSSLKNDRKADDIVPDWGLYLDYSWHASWRSEHINWPDYGLPTNYEAAAEAVVYAYDLAKLGGVVEVGCIGGHGRTGTALACMAILGGVPAAEVVKWVHENHCEHAIESKKQEWFPLWFDAYLNGGEAPPMPKDSYATGTTVYCTKLEHRTMWDKGDRACTKATNCKWWREDILEMGEDPGPIIKKYICSKADHIEQFHNGLRSCPKDCKWWDEDVSDIYLAPTKGQQKCLPVSPNTRTLVKNYKDEWVPLVEKTVPCISCKALMKIGALECSCGLKYTPTYWTNREAMMKRPSCPKVGTQSGDFIYTSNGWIHKSVFNRNKKDNQ